MSKTYVTYLAEIIGTFALSFVVLMTATAGDSSVLVVPVVAGLTLGIFVYTIGPISGCHINPAVTLGLWAVGKISARNAFGYIMAQIFGAAVAIMVANGLGVTNPSAMPLSFNGTHFVAEALGAFFFAFGIAAVVFGKVKEQMSGVVVGSSLLLGILIAVFSGSTGILNPAVAFALNSITVAYLFAPIVGAAMGFQAYRFLSK